MSNEMLSCIQQKIEDTHRRRLHDIPENVWSKAWCSSVAIASFPSQRIYLKNQGEMHIYMSILDRFQNDEKFHASQPEHHNWTEERSNFFDKKN